MEKNDLSVWFKMKRGSLFMLALLMSCCNFYGQLIPFGLLLRANGQFELVTDAALRKPAGATDSVYIYNLHLRGDSVKTTCFDLELKHMAVNRFLPPVNTRPADTAFIPKTTDLSHLKDVCGYTGAMPDSVKQNLWAETRRKVPELNGALSVRGGRNVRVQTYYVDGQEFKLVEPAYKINRLIFYRYSKGKLVSILSYDGVFSETEFDSLVYSKDLLTEVFHKDDSSNKKMIITYNSENKVQFVQVIVSTRNSWDAGISSPVVNYTFNYDKKGYLNSITEINDGHAYIMRVRKL